MKKFILTTLSILGLSLNAFGASSMTPNVTDLPFVVQEVSNLTVEVNQKVSSNDLASTTAGLEGIKTVGALGGYTLDEYFEDTATKGPSRDLPIFVYQVQPIHNLVVTWSGGDIYDPIRGYFHLTAGTYTNVDNAVNYAYWNPSDPTLVQWTTGTRPNADTNIYLATFTASLGVIVQACETIPAGDVLGIEDRAFADIMPSFIVSGMKVYATSNDTLSVVQDSGVEYHNMSERTVHQSIKLSDTSNMTVYSHVNGVWDTISTNRFPLGVWDNGSNLVSCSTTNWYRGVFVAMPYANHLKWIAPDYEYTNSTDAIAGSDPDLPDGFYPYIPKIYAYVFHGTDTVMNTSSEYWVDRRNSDNLLKSSSTSGGGGGANIQ